MAVIIQDSPFRRNNFLRHKIRTKKGLSCIWNKMASFWDAISYSHEWRKTLDGCKKHAKEAFDNGGARTETNRWFMSSWGFFKTARFGVEDNLTLFSRQTPPIGGKSAEKSCDSVAFATADTCGLNPPSRWFPSQSPTAQRGSDPVVCHGQRVRYCVLSPTTTGIPDSLVF